MENTTVSRNVVTSTTVDPEGADYLFHKTVFFKFDLPKLISVCVALGIIILGTVLGNIFVISAILLEKSLRATSNYLVLSLAVTDLMVAVLVMPISILNEISLEWRLGSPVCDMWISFDVLCCTASILHLVAIALDRYWSVTNVDYTRKRSPSRVLTMIFIVWLSSFSISIPPLLGWRNPANRPEKTGHCLISQDLGYTVFSTVGAFYIPLLLILALNYKIYVVAKSRFRKTIEKRGILRAALQVQRASITMLMGNSDMGIASQTPTNCKSDVNMLSTATVEEQTHNFGVSNSNFLDPKMCYGGTGTSSSSTRSSFLAPPVVHIPQIRKSSYLAPPGPPSRKCSFQIDNRRKSSYYEHSVSICIHNDGPSTLQPSGLAMPSTATSVETDANETIIYENGYSIIPAKSKSKCKSGRTRRLTIPEIKKEKRTASVLGIITGAFILCWLPFFMIALIRPFCSICVFPKLLVSMCLWFGYFNSMINPIIYTIFNPNFRAAFRKLLCGRGLGSFGRPNSRNY